MAEPVVAVVFSTREWANRVVRYMADHGGGRVRLRIVEARVALEEDYDVLLVEDVTSFLTARLVRELHRHGRSVLGVFDPAEPTGRERLLELGVDEVIAATAEAVDFVQVVAQVVRAPAPGADHLEAGTARRGAGLLAGSPAVHPSGPAGLAGPGGSLPARGEARNGNVAGTREWTRGRQWAVGGPPGGCGATEVAIELARALRRQGESVVLVDAEDVAPAVAQRVGAPPIPNIRTAIDALVHGAGELTRALTLLPSGGFELLAGLVNPADWTQLRPADAADVALELRRVRAHVVVNVGPVLEDLPRAGGPARFGLTRAMIESADTIIGVGVATPVGVARLLAWVGDVVALAPGIPLHLAINKAPASRFIRTEVEAELRRSYEPASLTFLPFDDAVEKAAWRGDLVAPGPFTKALGEVVTAAAGVPAAPPSAGWSSLPRRARPGRRSA
jgi:hypothetical protein